LINGHGAGFELTGQMMLGLPQSGRERDTATAARLVDLGVKCARIYPAVILPGTEMYDMHRRVEYTPISLDEAVFRACEAKKIFDAGNIKILRIGLHSSGNINNCIGPYHPAFGELVEGEIMYEKLYKSIKNIDIAVTDKSGGIIIETAGCNISKVAGHGRRNILRLETEFAKNIKIAENSNLNINGEFNIRCI
jgi:histone acetyltransferase (RNA polymerase elongator complex component)